MPSKTDVLKEGLPLRRSSRTLGDMHAQSPLLTVIIGGKWLVLLS
jgi:hypothetical protein